MLPFGSCTTSKNIAPAETARVVTSTRAKRKALGRGQLLVPYAILYKLPL